MDLTKSDIASTILRSTANTEKREVLFHGIPASPGIAVGKVRLAGKSNNIAALIQTEEHIATKDVEAEQERFRNAVERTYRDIQTMRDQLKDDFSEQELQIFDAHLLIAGDKMLLNEVNRLISTELMTASNAFLQTIQRYISAISSMPDQYISERAADIQDVAGRILDHLAGDDRDHASELTEPVVIIAKDLTPSDTATLDRSKVLGFAIETGSPTSHTAILARSMKIPAIVGMNHIVERLSDGDRIIIDGYIGMAIIHPNEETVAFYEEKLAHKEQLIAELQNQEKSRAETTDGYGIHLCANVEGIGGIDAVSCSGVDGIGLFRTEFLFLNKSVFPDEETQFAVYRELAEKMQNKPVIIRTLDVGGDKLDAVLSQPHEPNPFLGMRAIRLCLNRPELMRTQLRALLRASAYGNVKILFPMISSMQELDELLDVLDTVKEELTAKNLPFDPKIEVGVMIEIPSAALIADRLARKVDFFSIGTNDLVQYTLAVDRTNEKVAYLYNPMHPAVVELMAMAARAAHRNHISIGCCGELAGDPLYTPLLVGLGIQELSMSPASVPFVRKIISNLSMSEAEDFVKEVLENGDPKAALEMSQQLIARIAPDVAQVNKGF